MGEGRGLIWFEDELIWKFESYKLPGFRHLQINSSSNFQIIVPHQILKLHHFQIDIVFKELLTISQYPELSLSPQTVGERLAILFKTYGLLFLALFLVAPFIVLADHFVVHVLHAKTINKAGQDGMKHFFQKMGYWRAAIYIGLIGPLLEEAVFRLPLSLKKRHIATAGAVAVFLFSGAVFHHLTKSPALNSGIQLATCVVAFAIVTFIVPKGMSITNHRFSKHLIILSICLFGLMHIGNYTPIQWPLIWIYPIYVLPQLLMGWAITYIRFKNGFWWGYALHCIINCVSLLLTAGRM